ncbi:MAG: hypothetical protein HRT80_03810 [Henriciella sp.]|nr:hypothetical protein [Henriciella sp.]
MLDPKSIKILAVLTVLVSLIVQIGFAIGVFGPAWLSPLLTLPALAAMACLWRAAEKQHAMTQAFTDLVI